MCTMHTYFEANNKPNDVTTKFGFTFRQREKERAQIDSHQGPWCKLQRKIFINPHDTAPIRIMK